MSHPSRRDYLETKVMTASPAQLHLLLVEGAIRFTRQAEQHYAQNNDGHAMAAMVRGMDVVSECLASVRHDTSEINTKLASLYEFVYRTMVSCYVNADVTKLGDVLRILEFQRETWQMACETVAAEQSKAPAAKANVVPLSHLGTVPSSAGMTFQV